MKHKLADALLTLKNRVYKKDFKENFLKRVFSHTLNQRTRYFFDKWKHNSHRIAIAEEINVTISYFLY